MTKKDTNDPKESKATLDFVVYLQNGIVFIIFKNCSLQSLHLMRSHQHYEQSTLHSSLKGINIPYSNYLLFISANIDSLTIHEQSLHSILSKIEPLPTYIISSIKNDPSTLYHEYTHSQYYLQTSIQQLAHDIYNNLPPAIAKSVNSDLQLRGYLKQNYIDEFMAYLIESPADFGKKHVSYFHPFHLKLRKLIPPPKLQEKDRIY